MRREVRSRCRSFCRRAEYRCGAVRRVCAGHGVERWRRVVRPRWNPPGRQSMPRSSEPRSFAPPRKLDAGPQRRFPASSVERGLDLLDMVEVMTPPACNVAPKADALVVPRNLTDAVTVVERHRGAEA